MEREARGGFQRAGIVGSRSTDKQGGGSCLVIVRNVYKILLFLLNLF